MKVARYQRGLGSMNGLFFLSWRWVYEVLRFFHMVDQEQSRAEAAQTNPSYKEIISRLIHNPFATEFSQQRRSSFENWVSSNQDLLKTQYAELTDKVAPENFIPIIHGSVARGHGSEGEKSDVDGTIWYYDENEIDLPSDFELIYPEADWGVRAANVKQLVRRIGESRSFGYLAHDIAKLFGASTQLCETEGTLDSWRKEVLQALSESNFNPEYVWEEVQEAWNMYFGTYSKRHGEQEQTIKDAIARRLVPDADIQKLERGLRLVNTFRTSTQLPSFNELAKEYQISKKEP